MYAVVVNLVPPPHSTPLDEETAERAAECLGQFAAAAAEAVDRQGQLVSVTDRWVGTHPQGGLIALVVSATSVDLAVSAVTRLVQDALTTLEDLAGWQTGAVEVHHYLE